MIIPGDTGHPWRTDKFLEYQHWAVPVDTEFMRYFCPQYTQNELVMLAWYHAIMYCEVTALYLVRALNYRVITRSELRAFWEGNKPTLIAGSARKYTKNLDWFLPLMDSFMTLVKRHPYRWLLSVAHGDTPQARYDSIYRTISSIKYVGRFSAELFMESLLVFQSRGLMDELDIAVEVDQLHWKTGANMTSGMMNLLYCDDEADKFDKNGVLDDSLIPNMNEYALELQQLVHQRYPNQKYDLFRILTKLCSWRNLFKGSRYAGFHHDRQLGNIIAYEQNYPDYGLLWDDMFEARKKLFKDSMLGELHGWTGIRPERKKLWLEKGMTGVETVS